MTIVFCQRCGCLRPGVEAGAGWATHLACGVCNSTLVRMHTPPDGHALAAAPASVHTEGDMADGGRPNILSKKIQDTVVEWLRAGNTQRCAAAAAGISFDTLKRWRKLGKQGDVDYIDFYTQTTLAASSCESDLVRIIRGAADTDWKPAAWMLERRFSKKWWKSNSAPKEKEPSAMNDPELRAALLKQLELMAKRDDDADLAALVAKARGK